MADEFDYTPELYTLEDEDGAEQTFELIDRLECDGGNYFAFIPYAPDPEELINSDGELVILKETKDENDELMLVTIDDDDEFDKIGEMFLARLEEAFEGFDEDCCCDDCDFEDDACGDVCGCEECSHD